MEYYLKHKTKRDGLYLYVLTRDNIKPIRINTLKELNVGHYSIAIKYYNVFRPEQPADLFYHRANLIKGSLFEVRTNLNKIIEFRPNLKYELVSELDVINYLKSK